VPRRFVLIVRGQELQLDAVLERDPVRVAVTLCDRYRSLDEGPSPARPLVPAPHTRTLRPRRLRRDLRGGRPWVDGEHVALHRHHLYEDTSLTAQDVVFVAQLHPVPRREAPGPVAQPPDDQVVALPGQPGERHGAVLA